MVSNFPFLPWEVSTSTNLPMDTRSLGDRLYAWRVNRGFRTQFALEKRAGVSHYVVARIEAGKIKNPQLKTLVRLAEALRITVTELVGK